MKNVSDNIDLTDEECDLLDAIYLPSKYPIGGVLPDFEPDFDLCKDCLKIAQYVEKKVEALLDDVT